MRRSRRWILLSILSHAALCLTMASVVGVAGEAAAQGARKKPLELQYRSGEQIRSELGLTGTSGWIVVDLDTGELLDGLQADRPFVPASVSKLPTAAFALDAMGSDHRFETVVEVAGDVRGGTVNGDLVLRGGGDPELDTDALWDMIAQVFAKGVRAVKGRFVVDGSALPEVQQIEDTQGVDASYNPSVSGLNLNFNRVHLKWDARGNARKIWMEAEAERLSPRVKTVRTEVNTSPGAPLFSMRIAGGREVWQMAARALRGRASRWLPVKRPVVYAGEVFRLLATDKGIRLPEAAPARATDGTIMARHRSRPLGKILRDMLRFSTNITAEVTGSAATRSVGIGAQNLRESAEVMNAWAASVAGFNLGDPGFAFANHSGLSLNSRVSPRRMVELLAALGRRAPDPDAAHTRLPGGIAGYLKKHNVAADSFPLDYDRLEVVAKTGTMNFVRGLSGYIATPRGRRLAFAIFSNDLARRSSGAEKVNKRWMNRARAFERALIRNWVARADGMM